MFFLKLKIWWAERRMRQAILQIENLRAQMHYGERTLIPELEAEIRALRREYSYHALHPNTKYQWGGRTTDRLPLDGSVKPLEEK